MKKCNIIYAICALVLITIQTNTFEWDNKHFIRYTSNAMGNGILTSLAITTYYGFTDNNDIYNDHSWENDHFELKIYATALGLISLCILYKKYEYTKKKTDSAIKRCLNNCADIPLLTLPLAAYMTKRKYAPILYSLPLIYFIKYTLCNRPTKVDSEIKNQLKQ